MSAMRYVWWIYKFADSHHKMYWSGDGWHESKAKYFLTRGDAERALTVCRDTYVGGGRRRIDDKKVPVWYLLACDPDGLVAIYHETFLWTDTSSRRDWYERAVRFHTKARAANRANRERQRGTQFPGRVYRVVDQAEIDVLRVGMELSSKD